jgi:hypothetical protein
LVAIKKFVTTNENQLTQMIRAKVVTDVDIIKHWFVMRIHGDLHLKRNGTFTMKEKKQNKMFLVKIISAGGAGHD